MATSIARSPVTHDFVCESCGPDYIEATLEDGLFIIFCVSCDESVTAYSER